VLQTHNRRVHHLSVALSHNNKYYLYMQVTYCPTLPENTISEETGILRIVLSRPNKYMVHTDTTVYTYLIIWVKTDTYFYEP